jgi:hypothetical protein
VSMKAEQTKGREASPGGVVDVLVELGQQRARIMEAMRAALLRGDDAEALERARELTGLPTRTQTTLDT